MPYAWKGQGRFLMKRESSRVSKKSDASEECSMRRIVADSSCAPRFQVTRYWGWTSLQHELLWYDCPCGAAAIDRRRASPNEHQRLVRLQCHWSTVVFIRHYKTLVAARILRRFQRLLPSLDESRTILNAKGLGGTEADCVLV